MFEKAYDSAFLYAYTLRATRASAPSPKRRGVTRPSGLMYPRSPQAGFASAALCRACDYPFAGPQGPANIRLSAPLECRTCGTTGADAGVGVSKEGEPWVRPLSWRSFGTFLSTEREKYTKPPSSFGDSLGFHQTQTFRLHGMWSLFISCHLTRNEPKKQTKESGPTVRPLWNLPLLFCARRTAGAVLQGRVGAVICDATRRRKGAVASAAECRTREFRLWGTGLPQPDGRVTPLRG